MPPDEAPAAPTPARAAAVVAWIAAVRDREARRNAGDPGRVLARRLSNAELDYTIRDLTGVDIRPTKEFPVDPANEAGFDNSGESLAMSPALLKKYLAAARRVADHLVFKPDGFDFAPEPAVTETDRDKLLRPADHRILQAAPGRLCRLLPGGLAVQHRAALGKPEASLGRFAAEAGLSEKYLATVWTFLRSLAGSRSTGPAAALWRELPADVRKHDQARCGCERMRDLVIRLRQGIEPRVGEMRAGHIARAASHSSSGGIVSLPRMRMRPPGESPARECRSSAGSSPTRSVVSDRAPYLTRRPRTGTAAFGRLPPDAGLFPRRCAALRAGAG